MSLIVSKKKWSGVEDCRREHSSIFCILTDSGPKFLYCFLKDVIFVENSPSKYYVLTCLVVYQKVITVFCSSRYYSLSCDPLPVSTHLFCDLPGITHLSCGLLDISHLSCGPLGSTHLSCALPGTHLSCGPTGSAHLSLGPPGNTHLSCDPPGSTHLLCDLPGILTCLVVY